MAKLNLEQRLRRVRFGRQSRRFAVAEVYYNYGHTGWALCPCSADLEQQVGKVETFATRDEAVYAADKYLAEGLCSKVRVLKANNQLDWES